MEPGRAHIGASGQPPHRYGHVQGRNIAASLASFQHHAQASCDLRRALQTAAYTAAQTGLATLTYPALRERNQSIFECLAPADAESRHPGAYQKWHSHDPAYAVPGEGSLLQCTGRVLSGQESLAATHPVSRIAVINPWRLPGPHDPACPPYPR